MLINHPSEDPEEYQSTEIIFDLMSYSVEKQRRFLAHQMLENLQSLELDSSAHIKCRLMMIIYGIRF